MHSKGLMIGIYSSAGTMTCQGYPGSLNHEEEDVTMWQGWDIDYVKYDNCYNEGVPAYDRYNKMAKLIADASRPMFFSICNWGNENVTQWAPDIAQSWRTTIDV